MTIGKQTLPGAGAVPRDGDAEPDRVRGHVPAARGAGRPLHAQGARRLPGPSRRADRDRARARRAGRGRAARSRSRSSPSCRLRRARVYVDPAVSRYALEHRARDARARRGSGSASSRQYVAYGASPRGPINLVLGARALALLRGRRYVLPQDVRELAKDVLRHRMVLSYEALAEGVDADTILDRVLEAVAMPELDLARGGASHDRAAARSSPRAHARPSRARADCPSALLRKLDLTVRRRIDGLLAGDHRAWRVRRRHRARAGAAVRARRRRPPDRLERDRPHRRAARPRARRRAGASRPGSCSTRRASMTFGTADRRKWDVAEGVALAVGHFATRRGNRLGVATFGDRDPPRRPPRQGSAGLLALLLALRREPDLRAGRARPRSARPSAGAGGSSRRRSVVVVVSDFRGPRDWRAPLLRLAARHDVVAVEIRDPREQELPDVGDLWLVDPETRPPAPRRHAQPRSCASGSPSAAAAERDELARELRSLGVAARRRSRPRGDWLRDARRLPADRKEAAMTFAWPIALLRARRSSPLALLGVPARAAAAPKYACASRTSTLLANVVDRSPRWRRHVPPALALLALAALVVGVARPQIAGAVPRQEATVILAMDRSGSMTATDVSPDRMAAAREAAATFVDGPPGRLQGRRRVLLRQGRRRRAADRRPRRGGRCAQRAPGRERHGARRRDRPLASTSGLESARRAADTARRGASRPLVVLLLSDGASTTGDSSRSRRRQARPTPACRSTRSRSAPPTGTIEGPDGYGGTRTIRVPPDPETLAAGRRDDRRQVLRGRRRRRAEERLRRDRLAGRRRARASAS